MSRRESGAQEAGIAPLAERLVEDVDRVVGGAAARQRHVRDQPWQPEPSRVQPEARVVVVAQELARDLGDAVDRVRPLNRVLRRVLQRRARPEGADGAREEHLAAVAARHLQRVGVAAEIERPGVLRPLLAEHREERRHVVDGADLVFLDHRGDIAWLGAVDDFERPAVDNRCHIPPPPARGDDVVGSVALPELRYQLGADLPERAGDEDLAHRERLSRISRHCHGRRQELCRRKSSRSVRCKKLKLSSERM